MLLSIVCPVYFGEDTIDLLVERLIRSIKSFTDSFEIILIDDGSPDNSWQKMEFIANREKQVTAIRLSRNFGQHFAICAGLEMAKGEWVVVMDCDLQDLPEEIENLYKHAITGFDIVLGKRTNRQDSLIKQLKSKLFYKLFSFLTDTKQDSSVANFGIFNRQVVNAVNQMGDYFRVFPILVQWVGFSRDFIDVKHGKRIHGISNYSNKKLLQLAFDMIISFSDKPMKIGLKLGLYISIGSIFLALFYFIYYFLGFIKVPGYTSLAILISISTGLIITFLGLLGSYLAKISLQVKNRPKYIISNKIN